MAYELKGASLYALIDRMRELQRERRMLRWVPFCGKRKAAIDAELTRIGDIMFPPYVPTPKQQAAYDAIVARKSKESAA